VYRSWYLVHYRNSFSYLHDGCLMRDVVARPTCIITSTASFFGFLSVKFYNTSFSKHINQLLFPWDNANHIHRTSESVLRISSNLKRLRKHFKFCKINQQRTQTAQDAQDACDRNCNFACRQNDCLATSELAMKPCPR